MKLNINKKIFILKACFLLALSLSVFNIGPEQACASQGASINASIQIYPRPNIPSPTPIFILEKESEKIRENAKYQEVPDIEDYYLINFSVLEEKIISEKKYIYTGELIIENSKPRLSGNVDISNAYIHIKIINEKGEQITATVKSDNKGNWSWTPLADLVEGIHELSIYINDNEEAFSGTEYNIEFIISLTGRCVLDCDLVEYVPYIITPYGEARILGDDYVRREALTKNIDIFRFEDKGEDFDYNDLLIQVDKRDCSTVAVSVSKVKESAWGHEIRLKIRYNGEEKKDMLLWDDSRNALGQSVVLNIEKSQQLCLPVADAYIVKKTEKSYEQKIISVMDLLVDNEYIIKDGIINVLGQLVIGNSEPVWQGRLDYPYAYLFFKVFSREVASGSTRADSEGNWSWQAPVELSEGEHKLYFAVNCENKEPDLESFYVIDFIVSKDEDTEIETLEPSEDQEDDEKREIIRKITSEEVDELKEDQITTRLEIDQETGAVEEGKVSFRLDIENQSDEVLEGEVIFRLKDSEGRIIEEKKRSVQIDEYYSINEGFEIFEGLPRGDYYIEAIFKSPFGTILDKATFQIIKENRFVVLSILASSLIFIVAVVLEAMIFLRIIRIIKSKK